MITDLATEFEWIAIEMSEVCAVEREQFCDFRIRTCCDLKAFISFLALSISLFFDVGNEEDCT